MSHRNTKVTKQQPGTAVHGNILGCCLGSLHFLCDIHSIHPVLAEMSVPALTLAGCDGGDDVELAGVPGGNCIKIGLPGKSILR